MKLLNTFVLLFLFEFIYSEDKIKFVFSAIRHGARVPIGIDNNKVDSLGFAWERNAEELTNVGMRQNYVLGLRYREMYGTEMNINDNPAKEDLLILASYTNRTIQSQLSFYQGFYEKGSTLTENQKAKALPPFPLSNNIKEKTKSDASIGNFLSIYPFTEVDMSDLYFFTEKNCKGINDTINTVSIQENIDELWSKRGDILKATIKYDPLNPIKSRNDLLNYADVYIANYYNGNDLSSITRKDDVLAFSNDLQLFRTKDHIYKTIEDDHYIARIALTKMLGNLINYLEYRSTNDNDKYSYSNPKIVLNFFHEINIGQFLSLIKYLYKNEYDAHKHILEYFPFCSFFDFQLLKKEDKYFYYIRVIYNDELIIETELYKFLSKLKSAQISDKEYNSFCLAPDIKIEDPKAISTSQIVIVSLLSVFIISLVAYIFCISFKKTEVEQTEFN
jgi:hypothetical protein